jgi:hypothetical protein
LPLGKQEDQISDSQRWEKLVGAAATSGVRGRGKRMKSLLVRDAQIYNNGWSYKMSVLNEEFVAALYCGLHVCCMSTGRMLVL